MFVEIQLINIIYRGSRITLQVGNNSDFLKTDINVIANDRRERGNLIFLYLTNRLLRRFAPRNDKKQCFLENLKHYTG